MLEITPNDVAHLNDEDLRVVVARLCEAELRGRGYSASHVTWGGNQDAPDGGIDVRVALPPGLAIEGFVPRPATGFQVKRQDMPASEITGEMPPKGAIRPSIQDLADQSGAYVIVSSEGSTADSALAARQHAMREAVQEVRNANALTLDFYDRTRVATWIRSHEGLIPWVRSLVGRALPGWQSYGAWAYDPAGVTAEYLRDETLRIHSPRRDTDKGRSASQGIQQIREELRQERHVVRLVGLSGVGKTRLVQALFDERIGGDSLPPSLAIYTNMADNPDPQPIGMASDLVVAGRPAILVIDNCPPELHHRLSEVCRQAQSRVSVITIEYDIREDEPEGTEVFKLESSSPELIERLLKRRFTEVSQIDVRTIAEFSGGNARIAIALAETVGHNETVAGLTDGQLFQRLFRQRHGHEEPLYLSAQACALVYSFQGEDVSNADEAELARLGKLVGKTPQELYRSASELNRRGLVQQRSVWRAVLPHAIANRLAAAALQDIPYAEIAKHLVSSERLLKSFSRRIGYLHGSREAVEIVRKWLGIGGLLGNVARLDEFHRAIFENVAPVAPEDALAALERTLLGPQGGEAAEACKPYCDLLRSIAYDAALFKRCTALLAKIVTAGDAEGQTHSTTLFTSLFSLILSGTHATIEQRVAVIESLLASADERRRALGVLALKAALEAWHFNSNGGFEFGARSRDFGYWPRAKEDWRHWFGVLLTFVETLACGDTPTAPQARTALAEKFRVLWLGAASPDEIAEVCGAIAKTQFWPEGWLAVRQTLDLDGKAMAAESLAKLVALEGALRPVSLVQKVRAIVFSMRLQGVDLDEFEDHSTEDITTRMARTEDLAHDLGKAVANEKEIFTELLPEIVSSDGRLWSFGRGLLEGAPDAEALWNELVAVFASTEESRRNSKVFNGFLHQLNLRNPDLASALLDQAVEHEELARWYPVLQISFDLSLADVSRLKRSLRLGKAPASMYRCLAYLRANDPIPASDLKDLVLSIAAMASGYDAAIEILHIRLHFDKDRKAETATELVDAGCELMGKFSFTRNDREDYRLGDIARSCLKDERGAAVTMEICQKLKRAVGKYDTHAIYHDDLLAGLFSVQPTAAIEGLCGGGKKELDKGIKILRDVDSRKRPIAAISDEDLLRWCDQDPHSRYPAMAQIITISLPAEGNSPPRWAPIALRFLDKAPDPKVILRQFTLQLMLSGGGAGSPTPVIEWHSTLLDQLGAYPNLTAEIAQQRQELSEWIDEQKRRETAFDRQRDERFE